MTYSGQLSFVYGSTSVYMSESYFGQYLVSNINLENIDVIVPKISIPMIPIIAINEYLPVN